MAKQKKMVEHFKECTTAEDRYDKIIALGRLQRPLQPNEKVSSNMVKGCQSVMYLHSFLKDGLIFFEVESEALISSGLAILLVQVYSGESPEVVLKCPPTYLDELNLSSSLTPSRANGLYNIHLRMKQDALQFLLKSGLGANPQAPRTPL